MTELVDDQVKSFLKFRRVAGVKAAGCCVREFIQKIFRPFVDDCRPLLSSTLIPEGSAEPLNDPAEIRERYEHALDLIVDSGACHLEPTTVIDLAVSPPDVIRVGRGDPARLGLTVSTV